MAKPKKYDPATDPVVQELVELAGRYERGEISVEEYEAQRNEIEAAAVTQSDNSLKETDPDGGS